MSLIDVRNASKIFGTGEGRVKALDKVSFSVEEGEFLIIIGPSGCGKTTLLHLIGGLVTPTEGEVFIRNHKVSGPTKEASYVFQEDTLLEWRTIKKNLMLPIEIMKGEKTEGYDRRAIKLLKMAGLTGFENSYPYELSGGMKQRAKFLVALMPDPEILLLDEPFGALDPLTRDRMNFELLRMWSKTKKTAIAVTHDMREAAILGDRVLIMTRRPGKVKRIIDVDLPRPRTPKTKREKKFHRIVTTIDDEIRGEE